MYNCDGCTQNCTQSHTELHGNVTAARTKSAQSFLPTRVSRALLSFLVLLPLHIILTHPSSFFSYASHTPTPYTLLTSYLFLVLFLYPRE